MTLGGLELIIAKRWFSDDVTEISRLQSSSGAESNKALNSDSTLSDWRGIDASLKQPASPLFFHRLIQALGPLRCPNVRKDTADSPSWMPLWWTKRDKVSSSGGNVRKCPPGWNVS